MACTSILTMGRRLGGVDEHGDVPAARHPADGLGRIDDPEHVGDVAEGEQPGACGEGVGDPFGTQAAVVVDVDRRPRRAPVRSANAAPRQQVGVVLGAGQHDLVAAGDVGRRPRLEATRLMASVVPLVKTTSAGLVALRNRATRGARGAVLLRGPPGQRMQRRRRVGVVAFVEARHRVDDRPRPERRGRAVEVGERVAVHRLRQRRKLAAPGHRRPRRDACLAVSPGHAAMSGSIARPHPVRNERRSTSMARSPSCMCNYCCIVCTLVSVSSRGPTTPEGSGRTSSARPGPIAAQWRAAITARHLSELFLRLDRCVAELARRDGRLHQRPDGHRVGEPARGRVPASACGSSRRDCARSGCRVSGSRTAAGQG